MLTRGAVMAEQVVGGFSAVYPVLRAFEENNRARRGYFVETLGAAQFGTPGSIDRLRTFASPDRVPGGAGRPGRHRPGERLRRRAAVARATVRRRPPGDRRRRGHRSEQEDVRAPGRAQGRRPGRAGRRRTRPLRRAGRQDPAVVDRGRARPQGGGDGALQRGARRGRWAGWSCRGPTASPCTPRRRSRPRSRRPASRPPPAACACAPEWRDRRGPPGRRRHGPQARPMERFTAKACALYC